MYEKVEQAEGTVAFHRKIVNVMTSPTKLPAYQEERIQRLTRTAGGLIGVDPETDINEVGIHLDDPFVREG